MSQEIQVDLIPASSPQMSQTFSMSGDDISTRGYGGLLSPPASVSPNPVFIAASAASQIVTNEHENQSDSWFDQHGIEPSGETALVAPSALALVNSFLDQLLYNFLATSRSTSLSALRPAVREVLKPKLAAEAIGGADKELHEYLGGGEDEELLAFHNAQEACGEWDLGLVWRRTRLRCMVYSSLGDMEEEDEDLWTETENLEDSTGPKDQYPSGAGVVSPAVAIFLTSILEFMGEQALVVAGETAYHRLRAKYESTSRDGDTTPSDIADRVVVDETDMERVGLDRTLGRLWRGWKKRVRNSAEAKSMSPNRSLHSFESDHYTNSRRTSLGNETPDEDDLLNLPVVDPVDHEYAASVPLPISDNDVKEIETPWLKLYPEDVSASAPVNPRLSAVRAMKRRPMSLMIFPSADRGLPTPEKSEPNSPLHPPLKRSNSLTAPSPTSLAPKQVKLDSTEQVSDYVAKAQDVRKQETAGPVKALDVGGIPMKSNQPASKPSAGFAAGAAALATAAVAGIVAAAKGEAPATLAEDTDGEEPEILTSSRVSIGDRLSPDGDHKMLSRRSSARSQSVHSLRVVDVLPRSRNNSVDATDHHTFRAGSPRVPHALPSIVTDSMRVASPIQRAVTASPTMRHAAASPINIARASSAMSFRQPRGSAESRESISEEEEEDSTSDYDDSGREEETGTPIPLPNRSPLRDAAGPFTGASIDSSMAASDSPRAITNSSEDRFQLAAAPAHESTRKPSDSGTLTSPSTENLNPLEDSAQHLNTSLRAAGVPPLTPLREMMEGAPDTSDEGSSVAPSLDSASGDSPSNRSIEDIAPLRTTVIEKPVRSSPQHLRDDDITPTPETFAKTVRPIHTSGSGSSGVSKFRALRRSEESTKSTGPSFEELMQSDKTIQYTLTPQNMREIESQLTSPETFTAVASFSPPLTPTAQKRLTGLNSNPTLFQKHSPSPSDTTRTASIERPATNSSTRKISQARDARIEPESVGDFANFIRTTGPSGGYHSPKPMTPVSELNDYGASQQSKITPPVIRQSTTRVARSASSTTRLQARDATVPYGGSSSDLIDFIRQGPPSTRDNPRIPRTVAPFRTTMDSEQMVGAVSRIVESENDDARYSQASTVASVQPSLHSSVTSQSALLTHNYNIRQAAQSSSAQHRENEFDEDDMIPKRKTRRVKDPYAIDYSDDEDEIDYIQTDKPVRVEESLMDFLNAGPPIVHTSSAFDDVPQPNKVVKKSSSISLISRFSRKDSMTGSTMPSQQRNSSLSKNQYTPINTKFNGYGAIPQANPSYVSSVQSDRRPSGSRVQQRNYTPRDATVGTSKYRSETEDLADFLLNTPPPAPSSSIENTRRERPAVQQHKSSFSGIFGRKKKSVAL